MLRNLVLFAILSYQGLLAHANSFIQKPVLLGENVVTIMRKNGFSDFQREALLAKNKDLRQMFLTLDTNYLVSGDSKALELRLYDSQTNAAFRIWREGKLFGAEALQNPYKTSQMRVNGKVYGSLMGSILMQVKSNWIASRFMDAYLFDVKPKDLSRGARFWFVVEKKYDQGQFIKYGEIMQTSLEFDGRTLNKRFIRDGSGGIFVADQEWPSKKPFYSPVNYIRIASMFQPHRRHPITKRLQPHLGVDFEMPEGASVFAAKKGMVTRFGRSRAAGNYIVLAHGDGVETVYDHLVRLAPRIRRGLNVQVGEKIAEIGCTGYCTRPHLHFAVRRNGRMVDPLNYTKPYPYSMENLLHSKVASTSY